MSVCMHVRCYVFKYVLCLYAMDLKIDWPCQLSHSLKMKSLVLLLGVVAVVPAATEVMREEVDAS